MDDRGDLTTLRKGWRSKEFSAPRAVFSHTGLTAYELLVYLYLCHSAEGLPGATPRLPSYADIARDCRVSRRTALRAGEGLVAKGLLHKERRVDPKGDALANLYTILLPGRTGTSASRQDDRADDRGRDSVPPLPDPHPGDSQPGVVTHRHHPPGDPGTPRVVTHRHHPGAPQSPPPGDSQTPGVVTHRHLNTRDPKEKNNNNRACEKTPPPDPVVVVSLPSADGPQGNTGPVHLLTQTFAETTGATLGPRLAAQLIARYGEPACREKLDLLRNNLDRITKGPLPWYRAALEGDWIAESDWIPLRERRRRQREHAAETAAAARRANEESSRNDREAQAALAAAYDALTPVDRGRVDSAVDHRLRERLGPMAATLATSSVLRDATRREVVAELFPKPQGPTEEASRRAGS